MAWVIPFRDARIAIANEISMSEKFIDGNRLKGISSGGDQIQARLNFKDEQLYTIRATLFCLTNDIPQIKPAEEGLLNRICINELKKVYVTNPDPSNAYQAKEDRTLKDRFNEDKYKDALFFILVDEWKKFVAMGRRVEKPASVQQGIQEWVETGVSVQNILSDKYEFTKNPEHMVRFDDLEKLLRQKDCKDSSTKIGRELTRLAGHDSLVKKMNGRPIRMRPGIRVLEEDPDID
jgi:phage/plasmid-associated DNA primase